MVGPGRRSPVPGTDRGLLQQHRAGPTSTTTPAPPSPVEKGVINMPPRAFNQNQNAADAMLALESQGYIVQINNGGGYSGSSVLSQCRITSVDGLKGSNPPPNTTVFLTLSCPNSNN